MTEQMTLNMHKLWLIKIIVVHTGIADLKTVTCQTSNACHDAYCVLCIYAPPASTFAIWSLFSLRYTSRPTKHELAQMLRYKCITCDKAFTLKKCPMRHQLAHKDERPYNCLTCGKAFTLNINLMTRQLRHAGERPYKCMTCNMAFGQRSDLVIHERIHTGERPYKCFVCGNAFTHKSGLSGHQSTIPQASDRTNVSHVTAFRPKSKLSVHERVNSGEQPYTCITCGKAYNYSTKGSLVTHQMTHTGERSYKCITCDKAFSQKGNYWTINEHTQSSDLTSVWNVTWVLHESVHTGERPYTFVTCGKMFSLSSDILRHQRTRTGDRWQVTGDRWAILQMYRM